MGKIFEQLLKGIIGIFRSKIGSSLVKMEYPGYSINLCQFTSKTVIQRTATCILVLFQLKLKVLLVSFFIFAGLTKTKSKSKLTSQF